MGERSYLAIGDVLALLREEFPDVTISKIRFLESRGLLVPERTPSGYRKFYDQDVERLRWILRQQREHFLPLKVIKGRLENGMTEPETAAPALFEMVEPAGDPPPVPVADEEPEPVLVGSATAPVAASARAAAPAPASPTAKGANGAGAYVRAASESAAARPTVAAGAPAGASGGHDTGPTVSATTRATIAAAGRVAARGEAGASVPAAPAPVAARHERPTAPTAPSRGLSGGLEANPEVAATLTAPEEPRPGGNRSERSTSGLPGSAMSGASFTLGELASASGLDPAAIEGLESFGLIAGRTVAGVRSYDEEALLVAKLAAGFAKYGIEARHLRIFKHAADRQAGLFAQVVTPLLRQRNPEARSRALADLDELSELGVALMRCFSTATLRDLTGG